MSYYLSVASITLVVRLYRTGNCSQNVMSYYIGTTQDYETNDTSFESPNTELLESAIQEGVAYPKVLPCPPN